MTSLQQPASGVQGLPPDQRAVLEMVLGRGHSYDEIARLLKIDRAGVRQRALAALDALGPMTGVSPERRALITDYLLGQLPTRVADEVRDHLGRSAAERAWARVVASELAPLSSAALPPIPAADVEPESSAGAHAPAAAQEAGSLDGEGRAEPARPVSRLGGAILLGAVGAAIIAAILIFVVFGVGGTTAHKRPVANKPAAATATTASTTSTKPLAQINLTSPSHSKAVGIAEVIKAGNATGVVVVAQGLKANTSKNAYAIWLYNSPSSAYRLGYVKPGVTSSGRLQTAGRLPANASSYKEIVVALQQGPSNKPGTTVLRGTLSGV